MGKKARRPIFEEYAAWAVEVKRHAEGTVGLYLHYLENLADYAETHGSAVESLSRDTIVAFVATYQHYDPATQAQLKPALQRFYEFLIATGRRKDDPTQGIQFQKKPPLEKRPRGQVGQKIARLKNPKYVEMALVVGELLDAELTLQEIFSINERPPVPMIIKVAGARSGARQVALSEHARARLDSWGGELPIKIRAFQRALEPVGLSPKELGDPLRPGLADLRRSLLPEGTVRPELERRARACYLRGEHDTAIFEAMKAVEVAVRRAGGFSAEDIGVPLMRDAFHPVKGPLRDPGIVQSEREAASALFAGAIGFFKNPQSHREVDLADPVEVAGIIRLADVLLRIVERAR